MSDSETSDEDFRPGDKEESEEDSECEEEEIEEEIEASASENKRTSRRSGKTEKIDVKKDELESDEEDKSRTDALWKDFLSDVKPQTSSKSVTKSTTNATTSEKKDAIINVKPKPKLTTDTKDDQVKKVSSPINSLKLNEQKVQNGKGEAPIASKVKRPFSSGGLSAVLSITQKKQKTSILDSSLQDWKSFKEDEGLQEELKEYNKGKDGYLDRQDFLKRTDYRQFEIEKNLRRTRYK